MKVQVIVGSTRAGRVSAKAAAWVAKEAGQLEDVTAEVVDLADYVMPFFDEPISPQYNPHRETNEPAQQWLDKIAEADAYVLVTPEYNRSTSGVLKNALDYIDFQFQNKPVALVAHGSTGGAQAVAHLRGIIPGLQTVTTPKATFFKDQVAAHIDDEGNLSEELKASPYGAHASLQATLAELKWYSDALAPAREAALVAA